MDDHEVNKFAVTLAIYSLHGNTMIAKSGKWIEVISMIGPFPSCFCGRLFAKLKFSEAHGSPFKRSIRN